jgi:hypothetical protein
MNSSFPGSSYSRLLEGGLPDGLKIQNLEGRIGRLVDPWLKWGAYFWRALHCPKLFWILTAGIADEYRIISVFRLAQDQLNSAKSLKEIDGRGSKRWSFYIPKTKKEKSDEIDNNWWTVIVTVTGGCAGSTITYSCNCPDKAKQAAASATYEDDRPDYLGRKFRPRVFPAENKSRYISQFQRYNRGWKLLENIEYRGIQAGNQQVYRIYTDRNEKFTRSWTGSGAGVPANKDCKHQWAVKFYRKDSYTIPIDVPDVSDDDIFA